MASARKPTLPAIDTAMMAVGQTRVKPSDCFIAKAQTTSSRPAMTR